MSGIVVGIDGSQAADAALAFALEEAKLRSLPLRIVCSWEIPSLEYSGAAFMATPEVNIAAEHHADEILARAAEQVGPDPGIHVETVSEQGQPAHVLLEQAKGATLLVVGTRGRGGVKSLVLGSTSQAIAHHHHGPVAIVPDPAEHT